MDKPAEKRQIAWQPLTPRGVAAFAAASQGRLWLVQLIFAAIGGIAVAWCLHTTWVPVISAAVNALPDKAEVRHGTLSWGGESPQALGDNPFLSIAVDLKHEGLARTPAHVQVELGERSLNVLSLLGFVEVRYPNGYRLGLDRAEAVPWWGAWMLPLLAMAGATVLCVLMAIWTVMSLVYFPPAWLVAFFATRQTSSAALWRVCGAALLPAGLVFSGSIVLYGLGAVDLPQLALLAAVHIAIGWVYLATALFCLPERKEEIKVGENPFAGERPAKDGKAEVNENPFAGGQ